jgi:hypothetical protein
MKNQEKELKINANIKCPEHNLISTFSPPSTIDEKRKKLIVTFYCPEGHTFTNEFELK